MGLKFLNEDKTYNCSTKETALLAIQTAYHNSDVCIGELLNQVKLQGFSVQDVVDIFASIMYVIENDIVLHIKDGEVAVRGIDK